MGQNKGLLPFAALAGTWLSSTSYQTTSEFDQAPDPLNWQDQLNSPRRATIARSVAIVATIGAHRFIRFCPASVKPLSLQRTSSVSVSTIPNQLAQGIRFSHTCQVRQFPPFVFWSSAKSSWRLSDCDQASHSKHSNALELDGLLLLNSMSTANRIRVLFSLSKTFKLYESSISTLKSTLPLITGAPLVHA